MNFEEQRKKLVSDLIALGVLKTPIIIDAFRKIPRHSFLPRNQLHHAYSDVALRTVKESTISQPYTVAVMVEALKPKAGEKILEVGAGSGWCACLIGFCVGNRGKVITIEIDEDVYNFARKNIKKLGIKNVKVILGDGGFGYEKEMPYDSCIITAACREIPEPIIEQTKIGGRIVAPVGSRYEQKMIIAEKISKNKVKKKSIGNFIFVPLKGRYGFN